MAYVFCRMHRNVLDIQKLLKLSGKLPDAGAARTPSAASVGSATSVGSMGSVASLN